MPACLVLWARVPTVQRTVFCSGQVALYTTALGLMIAVPSLLFWRYFRGRVDTYLLQMEIDADRFLRHLLSLRKK